MTHPNQATYIDEHGTERFSMNAIVRFLLEAGKFDLNELSLMPFSDEDRRQFAQLIGYSVGGFHELPYATYDAMEES